MTTFRIPVLAALIFLTTVPAVSGEMQWKSLPDGTRVPVPPKEHPRLYLRADHLDDLRARINHPMLRQTWQNLQELAAENAHYAMTVDALRYLLDGDPQTGRRAVDTALEFLPQAEFREYGDVSRDYGRVLWSAAVVYDWCYSLLSSVEKDALIAQCIRLAKKFECGYPISTRGTLTGHVAEWMIMRDMLSAGVALYDEYAEMYDQAAGVFFRDFLPARNWFYPGGAQHQGVAYGDTRFGSDLYPLFIFDRMGFGNFYHPSQQFVPYHWIYMRRPDGRMMTQGDDFVWTPKLPQIFTSSYYQDGYILADYLKDEWDFSVLKHATHPMDQLFVLLWRDLELEPWDLNKLPTTRYFGFPFGWMVARTGWDENAVIANMHVNVYNFLNHQHHDAGAFQIWYKGVLAADTGMYSADIKTLPMIIPHIYNQTIKKEDFHLITNEIEDLWHELINNQIIDNNGVLKEKIMPMQNEFELILSSKYTAKKKDIFSILVKARAGVILNYTSQFVPELRQSYPMTYINLIVQNN